MKDKFLAKTSFLLSMGFWLPLFNIGLCLLSIILASKALMQINKDKHFGGAVYAGAAIVISFSTIVFTIIFFAVYMQRKLTCETIPLFGSV